MFVDLSHIFIFYLLDIDVSNDVSSERTYDCDNMFVSWVCLEDDDDDDDLSMDDDDDSSCLTLPPQQDSTVPILHKFKIGVPDPHVYTVDL